MLNFAWIIPLLPFMAFAINIFFGFKLKEKAAYVAIAAILTSAVLSGLALQSVIAGQSINISYPWATIGNLEIKLGYQVDALTALMLATVTLVASLIQIYSIGYMRGDARYARFFAYLSVFCGAMLTLVLANNFLLLYVAWELVGLSSYLLIGFWFERPAAALAAKKAFIVTRIGDVGLFIGILILFLLTHTLNFEQIFHSLSSIPYSLITIIGICIFMGAVGKSAQFPLHVWLPDAMEGPTPVSALIHAATMVAAGVYLVARTYPIFAASEISLWVVATIGAITLLLGASIATVTNDIKRILAYSTISQLGYMMLGLGVGGVSAGIFHLTTHAFFKALLFLGAGSIIHAVHTQDIFEMGGLWKKMPLTFITFLTGTLALIGLFPFAGFWSKDEIIAEAFRFHPVFFYAALAGVFLTAFYMARLCFTVFFDKAKSASHESPYIMTVPLMILAVFAAGLGLVGSPFFGNALQHFLGIEHMPEFNLSVMTLSTEMLILGIGAAGLLYSLSWVSRSFLRRAFWPLYILLKNKYFFDEIYQAVFVRTTLLAAWLMAQFDQWVIDGLVNLAGWLTVLLAKISRWADTWIVDGMVNLSGQTTEKIGTILRYTQTGLVQNYALIVFLGLAVMLLFSLK